MTNESERAAFIREDRYIVIKKSHLSSIQLDAIDGVLDGLKVDTIDCVVVEEDWPEHETVWAMIESRMTGKARAQLIAEQEKAVPFAWMIRNADTKDVYIDEVCIWCLYETAKSEADTMTAEDKDGAVFEAFGVFEHPAPSTNLVSHPVETKPVVSNNSPETINNDRAAAQGGDKLARDAARYRWLRSHCLFANDSMNEIWFNRHLERGETDALDRQIDDAIKSAPSPAEDKQNEN